MTDAIKHLESKYSYSKDLVPEENYIVSITACKLAYNEAIGDVLTVIGELDKYWCNISPDVQARAVDLIQLIDKVKEKIK